MERKDSKKDVLEAYKEICLKKGAVTRVGPSHYGRFINSTDDALSEMIQHMLLDRAVEISGGMNAYPRMKADQDIFDYIETMLTMIAHGYVQVQEGSLGCYAPIGPGPSQLEEDEIDHKILASRHLFHSAVLQALNLNLGGYGEREL